MQQQLAERTSAEPLVAERRSLQPHPPLPSSLRDLHLAQVPQIVPVPANSSLEKIIALVKNAGARSVDLLVPHRTKALRSTASMSALHSAAEQAGVILTIFTSEPTMLHLAQEAGLAAVGVEGRIEPPRPSQLRRNSAPPQPKPPADHLPEAEPEPPTLTALPGVIQDWQPHGGTTTAGTYDDALAESFDTEQTEEPLTQPWVWRSVFATITLATAGLLLWQAIRGGPQLVVELPASGIDAVETQIVVPLSIGPVSDPSSIEVQGLVTNAEVTSSFQGTVADALVPVGYARGEVTVYNRLPDEVILPAGTTTRVRGVEFVVENDVIIPPAVQGRVGTTYGMATATLRARTPGAIGNIPPSTIASIRTDRTTIQGPLRIVQPTSFDGGSDRPNLAVAPSDVDRVLDQTLDKLHRTGVAQLQAELEQPSFTIDPQWVEPSREQLADVVEGRLNVDPPIGALTENGTFTVEVTTNFRALAEPDDAPMSEQMLRAIRNQLAQTRPDLPLNNLDVVSWQRTEDGLEVDVQIVPRMDAGARTALEAQISSNIAGRSRAEAQQYLHSLILDNRLGSFELPPDWQRVPENVRVTVRGPLTEAGDE